MTGELLTSVSVFVLLRRKHQLDGVRAQQHNCKNVRWVISYTKVHLTDVQMALWSCAFSPSAQSRANPFRLVPRHPEHVKTNTGNNFIQLEEVTTVVRLWRSHCNIQLSVNGRDRLPFVPSHTVYHIILQLPHEKAIYKHWRLTICTGLIKRLLN